MMEVSAPVVTIANLVSESFDHYLVVYEGELSDSELWKAIKEEFGDEAEYLSAYNTEVVRFKGEST